MDLTSSVDFDSPLAKKLLDWNKVLEPEEKVKEGFKEDQQFL